MLRDFHPLHTPSRKRSRSPRRRLPSSLRFLLAAIYLSVIACVMALVQRFLARP
jgi:hypothetical protein